MRGPAGASASATVQIAATMTALRYGARNPVQFANPGMRASPMPGASTEALP